MEWAVEGTERCERVNTACLIRSRVGRDLLEVSRARGRGVEWVRRARRERRSTRSRVAFLSSSSKGTPPSSRAGRGFYEAVGHPPRPGKGRANENKRFSPYPLPGSSATRPHSPASHSRPRPGACRAPPRLLHRRQASPRSHGRWWRRCLRVGRGRGGRGRRRTIYLVRRLQSLLSSNGTEEKE